MEKQGWFRITENAPLAREVYRLTLRGDTGAIRAPGQFVNIALAGRFLRRPISVCDWKEGELTLIYKVLGEGTRQMSRMAPRGGAGPPPGPGQRLRHPPGRGGLGWGERGRSH